MSIPWPHITRTYNVLLRKLSTVPPHLRIAVIDHWIGLLTLERSKYEARLAEVPEAELRRYRR